MTDMFPHEKFLKKGYNRAQVDEFFANARIAYERPALDADAMSSFDVRRAAFDMVYRGYKTSEVDAALDRLEAAFAVRARDEFVRTNGQQAWMTRLAQSAQVLYPRLRRPLGQRFSPPTKARRGYDAREVDTLLNRLIAFFDSGQTLTPDDVRNAVFNRRGRRGAYDERVVDAYLARVVDILQGAQ
jgi:DivIVA domain-containing protein